MSDYPKYQISKFLDSKREYQIVIRTDDFEELVEAMKEVKPWIEKMQPVETAKDVMDDQLPERINCKEHGEAMYLRDGKYGKYYSHKWGDGWCNLKATDYLKGR